MVVVRADSVSDRAHDTARGADRWSLFSEWARRTEYFIFEMVAALSTLDAAAYARDWHLSRMHDEKRAVAMCIAAIFVCGKGVGLQPEYAATWLWRATDHRDIRENAIALFCLAKLYWMRNYIPGNRSIAIHCLKRAASTDFAPAQFALGYLCLNGEGIDRNIKAALRYLDAAADQDYVRAELALGELYLRGMGVSRDYSEAAKWIHRAASKGMPEAQYNMALLYLKGCGIKKDYNKAVIWLRNSAKNGNLLAQFVLGTLTCTDARSREGLMWLNVAAERGLHDAQYALGALLSERNGDEGSLRKAAYWLKHAASSGR